MNDNAPVAADTAFDRLGQITRQLNQAMTELGFDVHLHRIATEIPDARDRLAYVGQMTESAAHRVLSLVESAKPECASLTARAEGAQRNLDGLLAAPPAAAASLHERLGDLQHFVREATMLADNQERTLTEIMMAQDFQDLSGQVIKKVIDIISRTEQQLVQLLHDTAPEHVQAQVAAQRNEQLQGPQMPDKALQQNDVDDLLAQMGF